MASLTHIRLLVDDFAACFQFYRDVMGFEVQMGSADDPTYAEFKPGSDGIVLALFPKEMMADTLKTGQLPAQATAQDGVVLCVAVDDVDAMAERVASHGVELLIEPTSIPAWGLRAAHFRDPSGNLIEINAGLSQD